MVAMTLRPKWTARALVAALKVRGVTLSRSKGGDSSIAFV